MKTKMISITIFLFLCFCIASQESNYSDRNIIGENKTKEFLFSSLNGNEFNIINNFTLIPDKKTAISVSESVLFNIYGRENIINQRPYEIYLIDGYWVIMGTIEKGWLGGTFQIIINAETSEIILIGHGE